MPSTTATIMKAPSSAGGSALNTVRSSNGQAKRLHKIPYFSTKEAERRWQLEQMAGAFRVFARLGFCDGSSGHISLRDMVHVDEDGNRIGGSNQPVNTAGFIIHSSIHKRRPDINAACHMHSPYGRAWATFGKPIDMLNQDSCMFYDDLAVYANFGGVAFAKEEGVRLAEALGSSMKNLIMQNHGLLTSGGTIGEAAAFFIALERACQTQLLVEAAVAPDGSKLEKTLVSDEEALYTKQGTGTPEAMCMQFEPEYRFTLKDTGGDFLE
ncbi:Fc.00g080990.m01.CDS01 [Cosmosporella sp. VM-42]